ncbi:MAG: thioesterase family protein [Bacteroidota bacterium]
MIINLKTGIQNTLTREVKSEDTASAFGDEHLPVLATSRIVAFMEYTALNSVKEYLPDGYSSVGTEIHLSHSKPVSPGAKVTCFSKLTEVEGRKLVFDITLRDSGGLIASAVHTRMIINNIAFRRILNKENDY